MTTKSKRNKFIEIKGASMHNLKNIDLDINLYEFYNTITQFNV